jgi:hypothetical protein
VVAKDEPVQVRVRVPIAIATMHMAWGWGFLTSRQRPRSGDLAGESR